MPRFITFMTDFGTRDAYVAAMKGVAYSICPDAVLVDITHEIPPQDVPTGAYVLADAAPMFPKGTIHVCVVDPGVGTTRRGVAIETDDGIFVGPDNGLFGLCLRRTPARRSVSLENPELRRPLVSSTFHGRDIFAPAAAHLASGVDLSRFGPAVHDLARLPLPQPVKHKGSIEGEVVHVDRFGNLVTNIDAAALPVVRSVDIGFVSIAGLASTFGSAAHGELLALVGSSGFLEVSVRDGSATDRLGIGRGTMVVVRGEPSSG